MRFSNIITVDLNPFYYLTLILSLIFCALKYHKIYLFFSRNWLFFVFTIIFITSSFLYALTYTIVSYGSPFVYEEHITNLHNLEYINLSESESISTQYKSSLNNLGLIYIPFKPTEIQLLTQGENSTAEEANFIFSIAKINDDPFYEAEYTVFWTGTDPFVYPFGFPIENNSRDSIYKIKITHANQSSNKLMVASTESNKLVVSGKYLVPIKLITSQTQNALDILLFKTKDIFENQVLPFLTILTVIYYFLIREWLKTRSFRRKYEKIVQISIIALILLQVLGFLNQGLRFPESFDLSGWYLYLVLIISSSLLFLIYKKSSFKKLDSKGKENEVRPVNKKDQALNNKIPIIGKLINLLSYEKIVAAVFLGIILGVYTASKAPYFDISFAGAGSTKYLLYVGPAKVMYENKNPFYYQAQYRLDPVKNPDGSVLGFGSLPLNEWGLMTMFYLFPSNSMEFNTHLFTHILGLSILLASYLFFRMWLNRWQSLLVVFLISINPVFNYTTFIPLEDGWLMLFTFLSLFSLSHYVRDGRFFSLYLSGVFLGLGNVAKPSIFLWLFPIIIVILWAQSRKKSTAIRDIGIIGFISLLFIVVYRTTFYHLLENVPLHLSIMAIWVIVIISIYFVLKKYAKKIANHIESIINNRALLVIFLSLIAIICGVFLKYSGLMRFAGGFLTNSHLLFNWQMYWQMMINQYAAYMTFNVFILGMISFFLILFYKSKKQVVLITSFATGSLIYWILASQSIWFHMYYTNIIMATFALVIGVVFYAIGQSIGSKNWQLLFFVTIIMFVFPPSLQENQKLGERREQDNIMSVAKFLKETTQKDDLYMVERWELRHLSIYSNRRQIYASSLIQPAIIKSIRKVGISETMDRFNISYLITRNETPDYSLYKPLFSTQDLDLIEDSQKRYISDRTSRILMATNKELPATPKDYQVDLELEESLDISNHFRLIASFGPYRVFIFTDSNI